MTVDAFNRPLRQPDAVLSSLRVELGVAVQHDVRHVISLLARATRLKLEDQLARYLTGDLSAPSQDQLSAAASAPLECLMP